MQATNDTIQKKVTQFLVDAAADLFKIRDMNIDTDIEQYGFDSIGNTQYANKINEYYNIDVMPTVFFEFEEPTIRVIVQYLCEKYPNELKDFYNIKEPEKVDTEAGHHKNEITQKENTQSVRNLWQTADENPAHYVPVMKKNALTAGSRFIHQENREEKEKKENADRVSRFIHTEKVECCEAEPVAIIGMQGCFPQSENLEEFWTNLADGKQVISEIPSDRYDWKQYEDTTLRWGGFMNEVDKFDAEFFGISAGDAKVMDPQHRLFIQTAWGAFEDAGYRPSDLSGTKTGVFVGIRSKDYQELMNQTKGIGFNLFALSGGEPFMLCNRLSSMLNLHGPSEAIDTTCSSSLVAVHKAVESIQLGTSEMAVAGGVNVILTPHAHMAFSSAGLLSKTGKCNVFDKDADGTIRSEGVGAVVLKSLSAARRDGDHIYALIKASSQNHKGKSASLTAPNAKAEADLIMDVFHKANVDPSTVNYIEAHSTGTKLGDPVEIEGLKKAFKELYQEYGITSGERTCAISSLKANMGHLDTASGIAALIKVVLSLKENQILGVKDFKELNPYIDLNNTPFYINKHNRSWERTGEGVPRRAGISAFGYGGVNAHVMIEEYMEEEGDPERTKAQGKDVVFVLSAKKGQQLNEQAELLYKALEEKKYTDADLPNIAYTLQTGREVFEERLAFTAASIQEAKEKLLHFIQGKEDSVYRGRRQKENDVIKIFQQDAGMKEIVKSWIENGDYQKLLNVWVNGYQIDWNLSYDKEKVRKVSLPSYPFEKKRYWLDMDEENNCADRAGKEIVQAVCQETKSEKKKNLPQHSVENVIRKALSKLLCVEENEIKSNLELKSSGADSIILTQLLHQLQNLNPNLDFEMLFSCDTVNDIVKAVMSMEDTEKPLPVEQKKSAVKRESAEIQMLVKEQEMLEKLKEETDEIIMNNPFPELIHLNRLSTERPIFWFHGGFGGVEVYRIVASALNRPFYGIQAKGYLTEEFPILGMEEMCAYYVEIIKSVQKEGPYDLGGLSMGGLIAYEVARQLQGMGERVSSIVMLETIYEDYDMKEVWDTVRMDNMKKERMLRAANLLLGFDSAVQLDLVSKDDIDTKVSDSEFLEQLIAISCKKAKAKSKEVFRKSIIQLERLLHTLDISSSIYGIPDLPRPEEIDCYYFCNRQGGLFAEDGTKEFFQIVDTGYVFNYWEFSKKWRKKLPKLKTIRIETPSHFTILAEPGSQKTITEFCNRLYAGLPMSPQFLDQYLLKE